LMWGHSSQVDYLEFLNQGGLNIHGYGHQADSEC